MSPFCKDRSRIPGGPENLVGTRGSKLWTPLISAPGHITVDTPDNLICNLLKIIEKIMDKKFY